MNKKFGIKAISINEYFPSFLNDCQNHLVNWQEADEDIYSRIRTFLILIAKIKFKSFKCYCCVYPHSTSAEYTVLADVDLGNHYFLLTTIRDRNFYPDNNQRIHMLKEELILLDVSKENLITLREEMTYLLHPDGQFRHLTEK